MKDKDNPSKKVGGDRTSGPEQEKPEDQEALSPYLSGAVQRRQYPLSTSQITALQRAAGNSAVTGLLSRRRASPMTAGRDGDGSCIPHTVAASGAAAAPTRAVRSKSGPVALAVVPGSQVPLFVQRYSEEDLKKQAYSIWEAKGRPPNQTKEEQDADYAKARQLLHQKENPVISSPALTGTSAHPVLRRGQPADPTALTELQQKLGSVLGATFIESMKADAEEDVKTRAYAIWEAKGSAPNQTKEQRDADYLEGQHKLDEDVKTRAYSNWEAKGSAPNQTKEQRDADYLEARQQLRSEAGLGPATEAAIKEFQKRNGKAETGVADAETWLLLDAAGKSSVGRVERQWNQQMSYGVTGMTSKYSWAIEDRRIVIRVGIKFVAHPTNPPANLTTKVAKIKQLVSDTWNRFKAVRTDGQSDARDIVFELPPYGGNVVKVVDGDGQSDAANWFWGDVITYPNVPAHEFGHMIGLEDEYQRPEPAFQRLFPGKDVSTARGAGGYDGYTDLTSLMGIGSLDTHPDRINPPEARHVREFVKFIEDFVGGTWEARPR